MKSCDFMFCSARIRWDIYLGTSATLVHAYFRIVHYKDGDVAPLWKMKSLKNAWSAWWSHGQLISRINHYYNNLNKGIDLPWLVSCVDYLSHWRYNGPEIDKHDRMITPLTPPNRFDHAANLNKKGHRRASQNSILFYKHKGEDRLFTRGACQILAKQGDRMNGPWYHSSATFWKFWSNVVSSRFGSLLVTRTHHKMSSYAGLDEQGLRKLVSPPS